MKHLVLLAILMTTSMGLQYDKKDSIEILSKNNIPVNEIKKYYAYTIDIDLKKLILRKGIELNYSIDDIKSLDLNESDLKEHELLLYLASSEIEKESYYNALMYLKILSEDYNMRYIDEDISDIAVLASKKADNNKEYKNGLICAKYGFEISNSMIEKYRYGENDVTLFNYKNKFRRLIYNY